MFTFLSAWESRPRRKDRFLTLYDSPRFPREVWDGFRVQCAANGEKWIDVLRQLMERHGTDQKGAPQN